MERQEQDLLLLSEIKQSKASAYQALFNAYNDYIYSIVRSYVKTHDLVDDLVIECFTKVFANLHKYQPEAKFSSWLSVVCKNHVLDFLRKQDRQKLALINKDDEALKHVADTDRDPLQELVRQEKHERLKAFLNLLKPKYKELLQWRYFEDKSYEEIAALRQAPLGTIKAQLHRSKDLLYQLIKNQDQEL